MGLAPCDRIGYNSGAMVHPLKNYRTDSHLTQRELAELVGVERETVARWEMGIRTPSLAKAAKLSEITGIPIDKFVKQREAAQ